MNAVEMMRRGLRGAGDIRGPSGINVSQVERALSVVVGGMLVAGGLRRRSLGGMAAALAGGELLRRGITGHSILYQKVGLHTVGGRALPRSRKQTDEMQITRAITIGKPADELHRMWRDPQVLPQLMAHFADVSVSADGRMHWAVRGPMERRIEFDTELVEDRPGELMRWRAPAGAPLLNEGSVQFRPAPGARGTEVVLQLRFSPPGGTVGKTAMKVLGFIPKQVAYKTLWRLKALAETGEIPSIINQPAARYDGRDREGG
jgi:uncharacterized membrane protein